MYYYYTTSSLSQGSLYSRGKYILFADADAATDINDLENILKGVKKVEKNGLGCAIGSRYSEEATVQVIYSLSNYATIEKCNQKIHQHGTTVVGQVRVRFPNQGHLMRF